MQEAQSSKAFTPAGVVKKTVWSIKLTWHSYATQNELDETVQKHLWQMVYWLFQKGANMPSTLGSY